VKPLIALVTLSRAHPTNPLLLLLLLPPLLHFCQQSITCRQLSPPQLFIGRPQVFRNLEEFEAVKVVLTGLLGRFSLYFDAALKTTAVTVNLFYNYRHCNYIF
jgi:hypothetical protein